MAEMNFEPGFDGDEPPSNRNELSSDGGKLRSRRDEMPSGSTEPGYFGDEMPPVVTELRYHPTELRSSRGDFSFKEGELPLKREEL